MNKTSIEWTDFTANPLKFRAPDGRVVWACEKLSPGCAHCYAEHLSTRYGGTRRAGDWNAGTMATLTPFLDEKELRAMLAYKPASGKRVFVGDMTDVFGSWVPDELLDRLFAVFALRPDVTFQVLTKRAERMRAYLTNEVLTAVDGTLCAGVGERIAKAMYDIDADTPDVAWPLPNVWLGVSVENQRFADERIPLLLQTPAALRFISAEPLLGPVRLYPQWLPTMGYESSLPRLDWVIVGGESGLDARPFDLAWARDLVRTCREARDPFTDSVRPAVPVFVKQLGAAPEWSGTTTNPRTLETEWIGGPIKLRDRKGGDPSEWPADLRVRQFPKGAA